MVFVILTVAVTLLTVPAALAQYNTPIPPGGGPGVDINPGTPGTPGTPGAPGGQNPGTGGSVGGPGGGGGTGVVPGGSGGTGTGGETPAVVREEVVERPQGAGEGGGEGRENTGRRRNRGGRGGDNLPLTGGDIAGLTLLAAGTIAIGTMLTVKNRRRSLPG